MIDLFTDDGEPGYVPTVEVVRIVRSNFDAAYIRRVAVHCGFNLTWKPGTYDAEMDQAVAIEMACREILDANRWLLPL